MDRFVGACMDTGRAVCAAGFVMEDLDGPGLGFRVCTPFAAEWAAFEKYGCPYPRAVVCTEFLDIKYDTFVHGMFLLYDKMVVKSFMVLLLLYRMICMYIISYHVTIVKNRCYKW